MIGCHRAATSGDLVWWISGSSDAFTSEKRAEHSRTDSRGRRNFRRNTYGSTKKCESCYCFYRPIGLSAIQGGVGVAPAHFPMGYDREVGLIKTEEQWSGRAQSSIRAKMSASENPKGKAPLTMKIVQVRQPGASLSKGIGDVKGRIFIRTANRSRWGRS